MHRRANLLGDLPQLTPSKLAVTDISIHDRTRGPRKGDVFDSQFFQLSGNRREDFRRLPHRHAILPMFDADFGIILPTRGRHGAAKILDNLARLLLRQRHHRTIETKISYAFDFGRWAARG